MVLFFKKELLVFLPIAASLLLLLHSAYFTWKYFTVTPFWDFWNWVADYQSYVAGHFTFHDLIKPHNEHRIATTRIVLLIDAIWFHMTGRFAVCLNLALLAGTGLLLNTLARAALPALVTASLMASTCQWPNLLLPFQIQFAFLCLSIVAAAAMLARATSRDIEPRAQAAWAVLAGLCFLSASFSMAGGLLELPWLLLLLAVRRARPLPAGLFILIAAAATLAFLHGYHSNHLHPFARHASPALFVSLANFAARFLGSAFYAFDGVPLIAGYAGLALFALTALAVLARAPRSEHTLALLTITATIVTIAAAAATSRMSFGPQAALEPRYTTVSLLFWATLLSASIQLSPRWAAHTPRAAAIAMLAACNLSSRYSIDARGLGGPLAAQAASMRHNVYVPGPFSGIYYGNVAELTGRIAFLRAHELGIFAPGSLAPPQSIALPRNATTDAALPPCRGHIDDLYRLDSARFVLRGWLAATDASRTADWVALLTSDNSVMATVPATEYRPDLAASLHGHGTLRGVNTGITDPLPAAGDTTSLRAIGLFANAPALTCILPTPAILGPLRVQLVPPAGSVRAAPSAGPPALLGAFRQNGFPPILHIAAPLPDENLFASGADGDAATGQANFTLTPGPSDDVVIPFTTEPGAAGQQIAIRFADGTQATQPIPADSEEAKWRAVAVPHQVIAAHGGGAITVLARDAGASWGAWLGVATPMLTTLDPAWARLLPAKP